MKGGQKRSGTEHTSSPNTTDKGSASSIPRIEKKGHRLTTNTKSEKSTNPEKRGGRALPSQGNVRSISTGTFANPPSTQDVTVADDGTRRVREIGDN